MIISVNLVSQLLSHLKTDTFIPPSSPPPPPCSRSHNYPDLSMINWSNMLMKHDLIPLHYCSAYDILCVVVLSSLYVCCLHNKVYHNHHLLVASSLSLSLLINYRLFAHSLLSSSTNSVWVQAKVQVEMGAARVNYKLARKLVWCRRISCLSLSFSSSNARIALSNSKKLL